VTSTAGTMDCQQARLSLGVLVLGVIDPEERPALEAHLTGCERCSAELAELAVLPGLLHRLDPVAAAARTRCVDEFSTGRVCTVGLPCSRGLIFDATSGKTLLSYFSTSAREFQRVVQLNCPVFGSRASMFSTKPGCACTSGSTLSLRSLRNSLTLAR